MKELIADLRGGWARTSRPERIALGLIVLIAIAVRLLFLFEPVRYDEADTWVHYIDQPLKHSLRYNYVPNNHVLHTLLSRPFRLIFGGEVWSLRMVAFLSGVLGVPAAYVLARLHYGRVAGLLAAALIAGSSALIEFSTNARGYTLLALITMLQLALAARLVKKPDLAGWTIFAVLAALGFYTLPINLFALGIVGVWLVMSAAVSVERPRQWRFLGRLTLATLAGAALTLILYAPLIAASGFRRVLGHKRAAPGEWESFAESVPVMLGKIWAHWNRDMFWGVSLVVIAGFVAAIVAHRRAARVKVPLALAVVAWLGPSVILQRPEFNSPRIWLFLLPLYLIIAAGGLAWFGRLARRPRRLQGVKRTRPRIEATAWALLLAGLGASLVWRNGSPAASGDTGVSRSAPEVVEYLAPRLGRGDVVVAVNHDNWPVSYYFRLRGLPYERLAWEISDAKKREADRLWVVVGAGRKQTLEENLEGSGFDAALKERVASEKRFPHAVVYEIPLK